MTLPACDSRAVGQTCAELMALSPVLAEGWACAERSGQSVDSGPSTLMPRERVTPAMEAGLSDYVWSIEEIVGLLG